jgi:hypothetical protein
MARAPHPYVILRDFSPEGSGVHNGNCQKTSEPLQVVAPPSRRLSGGRLAHRRGRDAPEPPGKMPALQAHSDRVTITRLEQFWV